MKAASINKDQVLKSTINEGFELTKFGTSTAFLEINKSSGPGQECFLMIKKAAGNGYVVKGLYANCWTGYKSTQSVVKGLNKLGFDVDSRQLRTWLSK
jgi:hypothetical protein